MVSLLIVIFVLSLMIALGASAWFTRCLEVLSDHFRFSSGLLSLLGALGANIPNYIAALTAAISGQLGVGIGIIIGSNIYNIAIILGISTFASPTGRGIVLTRKEARDADLVGRVALVMMLTTALAVGALAWKDVLHASSSALWLASLVVFVFNVLTLGLFGVLSFHALQREPEVPLPAERKAESSPRDARKTTKRMGRTVRMLGEVMVALGIALGAVVVMVEVGQTVAADVHLPAAILSLVILAIATSLPNTVVAFTLARTGRASASIEEIFSSNSVNVALGVALPLLFWPSVQNARSLVWLDAPLMVALTLVALLCVKKQGVSRPIGWLLLLVYIGWIATHLFLS